jgi:hypothetical protein
LQAGKQEQKAMAQLFGVGVPVKERCDESRFFTEDGGI